MGDLDKFKREKGGSLCGGRLKPPEYLENLVSSTGWRFP